MSVLKNAATGAFVGPLADDSPEFRALIALRQPGSANRPVWEQTGIEDMEAIEGNKALAVVVPACAAGVDATTVLNAAGLKAAGHVATVEYVPNADIVGAATNTRSLSLVDETGTVVLATLALGAGVNLSEGQQNLIPNSGAAAEAAGDILQFTSAHAGTGIADPGGVVVVSFA